MQTIPNVAEFKAALLAASDFDTLDTLVESYLFKGLPVIFADDSRSYARLKRAIAKQLSIPEENVAVVGSAKVGFSLDPNRFPSPFGPGSDVDVVVVSDRWFDIDWLNILNNRRYNRSGLPPSTVKYLDYHRDRNYIYGGWIWPDRIASCLLVGASWFNAFKSLPIITGQLGRKFSGRLFRTWDHALVYYRDSFAEIRDRLKSSTAPQF